MEEIASVPANQMADFQSRPGEGRAPCGTRPFPSVRQLFIFPSQEGAGQWQRIGDAPANTTHFVDQTARYNTRYTYRVRAHSKSASSAWSNEVSVTTPVGP